MFARAADADRRRCRRSRRRSVWRADYGTQLRDRAAVLALAAEAGSDGDRPGGPGARRRAAPGGPALDAGGGLDAAGGPRADRRPARTGVTIDGAPPTARWSGCARTGRLRRRCAIANGGDAVDGADRSPPSACPTEPEPAGGNGYAIERSYFTMEGEPVDPTRWRRARGWSRC